MEDLPVRGGKGKLLDHISISPLHFEIVEQIQERMLALKLNWTICLKLDRKGPCYFLSEKELLASFPSSLANSGQLRILGGGGADHVNTINWPPMPWEIRLPSVFKCRSIMFFPFLPSLNHGGEGAVWVSVSLPLMREYWVWLLQSRKPSSLPDTILHSTLYLPSIFWHLKIDQGVVEKKLKSIWHWGVGCGKENIIGQRGVDDRGFLFLNWAKKTFLISGASWHSSCYFSPGFFLLTGPPIVLSVWCEFELWALDLRGGRVVETAGAFIKLFQLCFFSEHGGWRQNWMCVSRVPAALM